MMTTDPEVKKEKSAYISHPQLQDGFAYFICEDKKCKHQILPMVDGYEKTIMLPNIKFPHRTEYGKALMIMCRNCKHEYSEKDLERLTKKKKMLRAVKIHT